jgi:hypothetical protein
MPRAPSKTNQKQLQPQKREGAKKSRKEFLI